MGETDDSYVVGHFTTEVGLGSPSMQASDNYCFSCRYPYENSIKPIMGSRVLAILEQSNKQRSNHLIVSDGNDSTNRINGHPNHRHHRLWGFRDIDKCLHHMAKSPSLAKVT